jgi:hypothetical protein
MSAEVPMCQTREVAEATYRIYSARGDVLGRPLTDLDEAKRLAAEVSARQPGETISLVSSVSEHPAQGELTGVVARYRAGQEIPPRWRVDFFGRLMDGDREHLSDAGIVYVSGGSEIGPNGEMRPGLARNVVTAEADTEEDALAVVKGALVAEGGRVLRVARLSRLVADPSKIPIQGLLGLASLLGRFHGSGRQGVAELQTILTEVDDEAIGFKSSADAAQASIGAAVRVAGFRQLP